MHHRILRSALALALALGLATLPAAAAPARPHAATTQAAAQVTTQLPRGVRPLHYDIALVPDAQDARFTAQVDIDLEVTAPTRSITLNAAGLAFTAATLVTRTGPAMTAQVGLDAAAQTATFRFPRLLPRGRYTLSLAYSGAIASQAAGLFALDYDTPGGKRRALFTQFENADARRVIPSWDEPAYKASFALRATVPPGAMAVSNMPERARTPLPDGRVEVRFGDTPAMSTYLLFFALGDFERASVQVEGVDVGVVTRRGALPQAGFALQSSTAILREFTDYFGLRYPLPKLDNVAGPGRSQFFSAMENWGAIFTFEYALLFDPAISTQRDRQDIFATAAHEIAHQWFGNLVTMRWWDDLWLNEGFASWMESRTMARLHPEWNTALDVVNARDAAMARDALPTTHPVVQHVATVEQASAAFDEITYLKGEAVIRMLEAYVGEEAWRRGVRAYLREHAYGNTTSDDLWRQIDRAAARPVTRIARDFTLQPGVPLLRVDRPVCKGGGMTVALTQESFSDARAAGKRLRWQVPVVAAAALGKVQARTLVSGGKGSLALPGCGPVVVNAGQSGYYRTLYSPAAFTQLAANFPALAPIDQLGLLADTWALGMAGLQSSADFLDLAEAAPADAAPQVWARIARGYDDLLALYGSDRAGGARLARHAIVRLAPVLARTGWDARPGETSSHANLRERMIVTLARLGDPATLAEVRRRYRAMERDPAAVPAALRKTVLAVVAEHADAATWDALHAAARKEASPMVRDALYEQLATVRDPALARRALALALSEEAGATMGAAMIDAVSRLHPDLAFDFAVANLKAVHARLDPGSRNRFVPVLAEGSVSPATADKLRLYARTHIAPSARRDADSAIAAIHDHIAARRARLPELDAWLARRPRPWPG